MEYYYVKKSGWIYQCTGEPCLLHGEREATAIEFYEQEQHNYSTNKER